MAQIPKGRLVKGPCKPICRDCAIYFSITAPGKHLIWQIWVAGLPLTTLRLGFATLRCLEKVPNIFSQMVVLVMNPMVER